MSKSRLEKFLYALYSLDSSDLPTPLSRIEELYKCLVTGEEAPTFKPLSRVEKYLMAILGAYDVDELPNPISRVEVLLYKLATGDDNLDDIDSFLSEHEELLAEIIRNGSVGGNIDIEYVLYTLSTEFNTLYNTAEKPVKSAILKGNTLVNLAPNDTFKGSVANRGQEFTLTQPIQPNKQYILLVNITKDDTVGGWHCRFTDGVNYPVFQASIKGVGLKKVVFTTSIALSKFFPYFELEDCEQGRYITMENVMLLEYQQGMENWDIPYFEGMKSVKMPVLSTCGKNLFNHDSLILNKYQNSEVYDYSIADNARHAIYKLDVKANTTYSFNTGKSGVFYDNNNQPISWFYLDTNTITTPNNCKYIIINFTDYATNDYTEVQIEEGSITTSYEPYKSNILTVNEEVELRGIGDVKDELDLVEGIHTKRIGVMIMDDTTSIELYEVTTDAGTVSFYYFTGDGKSNKPNGYTYHYCDSLPVFQQGEALADRSKEWTFYNEFGGSTIFFNIKQDKVGGATLKHIKDYLKYNPIKITYVLENEEVKTVDLSVVDQDGNNAELSTFNDLTHVTLSSEELIPEAELEVATKNEEDLDDSSVYTTHTLSEEFNTLYNTAEKPVKSAILKGQTLVNLVNDVTSNEVGNYSNSPCKINVIRNLQNETLTIIFNVISLEIPDGADGTLRIGWGWSGQIRYQPTLGVNKVLYNYNQTSNSWLGVFSNSGAYNLGQRITISDVMVLEGDYTNIDIPYFEGMKSVKMPVLKTVGKNLFDGKLEYGLIGGENGVLYDTTNFVRSQNFIPINCEKVTYTIFNEQCGLALYFYDANKQFISHLSDTATSSTKTVPSNAKFMKIRTYKISGDTTSVTTNLQTQIQIEEGSITTSYEPYKSNILSTPQDLVLGGIGDVQDTLDLLTGEVELATVERGLSTLSNLNWSIFGSGTPNAYYTCVINDAKDGSKIISDSLVSTQIYTTNTEYGVYFSVNSIRLRNDEATSGMSVVDFKNSLSSSTNKIRYVLAEKVVKTVDLSVVNQDGNDTKLSTFNDITHVTLSSEGLIPEAELEVAEKVPEVAANMLDISREQGVINTATNEQSENVDSTMIATTEIYEELL